jgi:hypothetical protein
MQFREKVFAGRGRVLPVGARLVKSISSMPMAWIQDFPQTNPILSSLTSGDDTEAKASNRIGQQHWISSN